MRLRVVAIGLVAALSVVAACDDIPPLPGVRASTSGEWERLDREWARSLQRYDSARSGRSERVEGGHHR